VPLSGGRGLIIMRPSRPVKRHLLHGTKAGSVVEFALVLPVLALFLCGIMDLGNLFYQLNLANEAAREGARLAATGGTLQNVTAAVQNYGTQLQVSMNPATPTSGNNVTVTVTNSVSIMTPIISAFFTNNPYNVTGKTTMRVE
jgi:Flp pilus assembly protein TadG